MQTDPVLVTGAAGFIGFHVAERLLDEGRNVVGLDIINDYYDPKLKEARLDLLKQHANFSFVKLDLTDRAGVKSLFARHRFPHVVHLAAQAGVRYSIDHPHAYVDSNLEGFINVLEGCRHHGGRHLVFAPGPLGDRATLPVANPNVLLLAERGYPASWDGARRGIRRTG